MADSRIPSHNERARLLGLLQQAPGFLAYLSGRELVFEFANDAYLRLVGRSDVVGKPLAEALPEVAGQGYFELLDNIFQSKQPFVGRNLPVMLQRKPGVALEEAFVDFIYQPVLDDEKRDVIGILVQGHDVTETHREELVRRAAEERYRTLFESIDDGFCIMQLMFDAHGRAFDYRFLEANAAFEEHTGLCNVVGKTARELVPDLDESWFRLYGEVALSGVARRFENHAPAMQRWFEVYANRVGKPELRQVALVFKNITARKQAEAVLQEGEAQRERLLSLEQAGRARAEQASRIKDEFLAMLSHELRTPLSAVLGWVRMLRTGLVKGEERERALETIERNARAQAQLMEDLLDVSRILSGKLKLEVEPIDVDTIVAQAIETVRLAADAKGVRMQATIDSTSLVMGDATRLQQVVWNLLANAVKFTPKGGRVLVTVRRKDSSLEISVCDTGRGIETAFLPHVFEQFSQAEGGSTRHAGGLGLGLSIVKHVVEAHGGTVAAYSKGTNKGAEFVVQLPLPASSRRELSAPPDRSGTQPMDCPPELEDVRVLVVDDEPDARAMLSTLLTSCRARVATAGSVDQAMAMIREQPPDILISDIGMPEQDGFALIKQVRTMENGIGAKLPAIALTAYARVEDRTRVLLAGFQTHVRKPVEPIELLAVIASLLNRHTPVGG